jgi:hypothetical protein
MLCCSDNCKRKSDCGLHCSNNFGTHQIEDFSCYGSSGISTKGVTEDWWCGELGNYKMFQPIKLTREEFIALHCNACGSQRCEGIGTEWFGGCRFKDHLGN